ncbi:FtsW/RodA/SpoVE family cell cycle protein [Massilia niastensis]|uniref:FtsW/RodA/SpoVE family cell cycle protein n=1 Tax=Massilia niastensis TaxID=544911 RepID=UPI0003668A3E|nr:FtsW/RodA/SpoVE family cell cycle protein [Massilia niastensis]
MKARLAGLALPLAILGCLGAVPLLALLRAPAAWMPEAITIRLQPGEALTLGRQELAAPRAGLRQLALRRDAGGRWLLRNLEPAQAVLLRRGEARTSTGDTVLRPGQRLQAGTARFIVVANGDRRLGLRDGPHAWDYDGATVLRDGAPQPACPGAALPVRLGALWNRWAPHAWTLARPLTLGGNLHCGNRIAAAAIEPGGAAIARGGDGQLALTVRGPDPVLVAAGDTWEDAARREQPLAGADAFALGRTAFALRADGASLHLVPSGQVQLFAEPSAELAPAVTWRWRERGTWAMPAPPPLAWAGALAVLLSGALLTLLRPGRRGAAGGPGRPLAASMLGAVALLVLVTQRSIGAPGAGVSLLLAWSALALLILWPRRPQLLALSAAVLLGAGLLVQLEMGLGARDSAWLRHFQNTAALLALGLPGGLLLLSGLKPGGVSRPGAERVLLALAALALGALLLQVALGSETGVFDIQPVEFAKLALAALSAHCLALAAGSGQGGARGWRFWLRMAAPVLLFLFLLAAALVRVDDYSPLLLLLVWAAAMALAWCCATGMRAPAALLALAACGLLAGGMALQRASGALGELGFYPERFQVWHDPAAHPHTGQQMLLGARAVAQGGWLGADGLLGARALGLAAGDALAIPAVQDDFAPSFLLQRHGLAAGLALWCAQVLFLAALLRAACHAWRAGGAAGDFRRAWLGRFQCFALCGGAAFVGGHLLLSWGTNLAMFPIMGQPMSFLSAGGSHLLFFICPLLAFGVASTQSFEESQSCRSMSNTKC